MTVVADAGPLIALAKIGGLELLFNLHPQIITPPAVFDEVVRDGHSIGAPDAALLEAEYEAGRLAVERLENPPILDAGRLGLGERESIQLAADHQASWLLVDDLEAREAATGYFASTSTSTRIKGTLGVVTVGYLEGLLSLEDALALLEGIRSRADVWISTALCRRVEAALLRTEADQR